MIRSVARLALFVVLVAGCYTLQPVTSSGITPGTLMAFELNDAGRVAMGPALGPEVAQVEGRLIAQDTEYVVAVTDVQFLRAESQRWTGEQVRIKPAYVRSIFERRLSKARTAAVGAIVAGLIAAWGIHTITGGGAVDPVPHPPDTSLTQRIPRRP